MMPWFDLFIFFVVKQSSFENRSRGFDISRQLARIYCPRGDYTVRLSPHPSCAYLLSPSLPPAVFTPLSSAVFDAKPTTPKIIMACGRRGEWQRAVSTLGRIRRTGAAPDAHSFAMAMTACARAGESRQALRLLDELKREGGGVRPNTVVYNTLLALCRGKPLRGVRGGGVGGGGGGLPAAAAGAAGGTGPNLNGYGGGGGLEAVNGHGVAVDMPGGRAIRNRVSVPGGGTVGSGTGVSSPSGAWGERPDELVGTAVALLHEMTVGGSECAPDKMSFELVMQACVNAGRPDSALKVFRAMARFATGGGGGVGGGGGGSGERWGGGRGRAVRVRPDRATFRLGLTAAAEAGDGPAAAVLLEEMRDAGILMDEVRVASSDLGGGGRGKTERDNLFHGVLMALLCDRCRALGRIIESHNSVVAFFRPTFPPFGCAYSPL